MGKKAVINADDFGISHGTNIAIEKAYKEGILTSTSIMPTGPAFKEAVLIARKNKGLGVGVHISLTWGRSVSEPALIPALVDKNRYFYPSFFSLLIKPLKNKNVIKQAEREIRAQIEKVKNSGLMIDHLNSQIHIHLIPWIFPILNRLAKLYGIKYVRVSQEPLFSLPFSLGLIKWLLLKMMGIIIALQKNSSKQSSIFYGILYTSNMNKSIIKKILKRNDKGIVEILSHPGYYNLGVTNFDFKKQEVDNFIKSRNRKKELDTLLDRELKLFIIKNGIELINFAGIKKQLKTS